VRLHLRYDLAEALLDIEQHPQLLLAEVTEQLKLLVVEHAQVETGGAEPVERIGSAGSAGVARVAVGVSHHDLLAGQPK
jgi:selenocysteine lyase/cysteine desulfurase